MPLELSPVANPQTGENSLVMLLPLPGANDALPRLSVLQPAPNTTLFVDMFSI